MFDDMESNYYMLWS